LLDLASDLDAMADAVQRQGSAGIDLTRTQSSDFKLTYISASYVTIEN
jgi:hypothetical protein